MQSQGSAGEAVKKQDAALLRDEAKSCTADIQCSDKIAPEDLAAGRKVKAACVELQNGGSLVYEEKFGNSNSMSGLEHEDVFHDSNLGETSSGGSFAADTSAAMQAQSVGLSLGADAAGMTAAAGAIPPGSRSTISSRTRSITTSTPSRTISRC